MVDLTIPECGCYSYIGRKLGRKLKVVLIKRFKLESLVKRYTLPGTCLSVLNNEFNSLFVAKFVSRSLQDFAKSSELRNTRRSLQFFEITADLGQNAS